MKTKIEMLKDHEVGLKKGEIRVVNTDTAVDMVREGLAKACDEGLAKKIAAAYPNKSEKKIVSNKAKTPTRKVVSTKSVKSE